MVLLHGGPIPQPPRTAEPSFSFSLHLTLVRNLKMFFIFAAIFLPVLFYVYATWTFDYWKKKRVAFPEPTALFGNIKDVALLRKFPGACHQEIYWNFPNEKFVGIYQLRIPSLLIRDPDLVKQILVKDFEHFMDRGFHIDEKREPLTGHLVNLESQRWRLLRNKLTPAFSSGKIKNMFPLLVESAGKLNQFVKDELKKGQTLEVRETTARFTTDVIGSVAFGLQFNAMSGDSVFREMGKKALQPSLYAAAAKAMRTFVPWLFDILKMRTFPNEINTFFTDVVRETISYREKTDSKRNDFLQLMIHLKKADFEKSAGKDEILITENVIAAQAFVFFLAGFETSSTTISFCLYELSRNEQCQEEALEEINRLVEKHGTLTYEAVSEMNYLENVLLETMRLYPPVSGLSRVCTKAYTIPGTDVNIEPGVMVVIPVYALHHDPNYYPSPYEFKPERFNDKEILKSYTYMPFGSGPRICIGQRFAMLEMKLALAQLLTNYVIETSEKTVHPLAIDPKSFILAPVNGIWLKFVPRVQKNSVYVTPSL